MAQFGRKMDSRHGNASASETLHPRCSVTLQVDAPPRSRILEVVRAIVQSGLLALGMTSAISMSGDQSAIEICTRQVVAKSNQA